MPALPDPLRRLLPPFLRRGSGQIEPSEPKREAAHIVVVVSTDPLIREETSFGFPVDVEVLIAEDSRHALAMMRERPPDAVIVDIQTGNAGGFSLARDMDQVADLRAVPILMLLERSQDTWLARQAGAEDYRVKPIETGELVGHTLALITASA
jgi:DNA-binding response OmpR family regulator